MGADLEILHDSFAALVFGHARLERLWTGCRWAEGPLYHAAGRFVVWSDIPNDRVMRFDDTDGSVSVFEQPAFNANGHFADREGRIVRCEHRGRCVSRIEHDGRRTVLCSHWQGKRLNSPNDVIVKRDSTIWFSDPTYGIDHDYEGDAAESEIGASNVYRFDPASGTVEAVVTDMVRPNGLAFSPDESCLYVADTGVSHDPSCRPKVRVYNVVDGGRRVAEGRDFADCTAGLFDGMRCDMRGNLWVAAGDGIHCHDPRGQLIGKIKVPEACANLTFGGPKFNRLFICATTSLYAIYVNARGITPWGGPASG